MTRINGGLGWRGQCERREIRSTASKDRPSSLLRGLARHRAAGDHGREGRRTDEPAMGEGMAPGVHAGGDREDHVDDVCRPGGFRGRDSRPQGKHGSRRSEVLHRLLPRSRASIASRSPTGPETTKAAPWNGRGTPSTRATSSACPRKARRRRCEESRIIGLRDGKIVAERDYWDCATLLRQLGALK